MGHGLPFVYFEINGGNAQIDFAGNPTTWYNEDGVLGITLDGKLVEFLRQQDQAGIQGIILLLT